MRPVENRWALVRTYVLDGLRTAGAGADRDSHTARVKIGKRFLEGVGSQERQAVDEAPFQPGLEGVIVSGSPRFQNTDASVLRIWVYQFEIRWLGRVRIGFVVIENTRQMRALRTVIGQFENRVLRD